MNNIWFLEPPTQEPSVEIEIMYDILLRRLILRLLFFDATTDAMTVLFVSKHCSYAKRWEGGHSSKGLIGWKLLPVFTLPNSCPFASKLELCVPKIVESGAKSLRDDFCKYSRLLYFFKTLDFETHSSNQTDIICGKRILLGGTGKTTSKINSYWRYPLIESL